MTTDLEKSGDSVGSDAPVLIRNQILQVDVAGCHTIRVDEGKSSQSAGCSEFQGGLSRRKEEL